MQRGDLFSFSCEQRFFSRDEDGTQSIHYNMEYDWQDIRVTELRERSGYKRQSMYGDLDKVLWEGSTVSNESIGIVPRLLLRDVLRQQTFENAFPIRVVEDSSGVLRCSGPSGEVWLELSETNETIVSARMKPLLELPGGTVDYLPDEELRDRIGEIIDDFHSNAGIIEITYDNQQIKAE